MKKKTTETFFWGPHEKKNKKKSFSRFLFFFSCETLFFCFGFFFLSFFFPQAYLFEKLFPKNQKKKKLSKIPPLDTRLIFFSSLPLSRLTPVRRVKVGSEESSFGWRGGFFSFLFFFSPSLTPFEKKGESGSETLEAFLSSSNLFDFWGGFV